MAVSTAFMRDELDRMKREGLYGNIRTLTGPQGARIEIGGKRYLNLCSNNYLGLANDPRVCARARELIDRYGVGPGAVRTIAGTMDIHLELERKLARFKGTEAAITVQSGFCGNLAVMPTVTGEGDLIFSDALNHASIIDACRLSKARTLRYGHSDIEDLRAKLREHASEPGRRLIVTDGVFSMDGYVAPLDEICALADEYGALVMVDDSHAVGFVGETGAGTPERFGVTERVDIITGTLGKALGGASGGYTGARSPIVELLRQRSRPYLFSNSLAPSIVAATLAALGLLGRSGELLDRLRENTAYFRTRMAEEGFEIPESDHPIAPVMIGDAVLAARMADAILARGVYVRAFSYPVVPKGRARIRTQLSASLTRDDLDAAIRAFVEARSEVQ